MKRTHHYSRREKRWILGLLLLAIIVSLPVVLWTVLGYQGEMALRESNSRVCADVDAHQLVGRRQERQVRYHFDVGGERYTHADATGRSDLWASLSDSDSERVSNEGCVDVVYLAADPSVNRLVSWTSHNSPLANKAGGALLVALMLLLSGAGILGIRRVARTPVWRVLSMDDAHVTLGHAEDEQILKRSALRRSVLVERPRAMRHPPWRFPCDVLMLRTSDGCWAVGAHGPHWAPLVEALQREAKIKRKQSA